MPVIDASVYVSLANAADRHHERCLEWFESSLHVAEPLAAPGLLLVEVTAAIRRLTGISKLARLVTSDIQEIGRLELYPLTAARSEAAADLAATVGVRGADAVYLALAKELGETLVTLDRQQLDRGRGSVDVRKPA